MGDAPDMDKFTFEAGTHIWELVDEYEKYCKKILGKDKMTELFKPFGSIAAHAVMEMANEFDTDEDFRKKVDEQLADDITNYIVMYGIEKHVQNIVHWQQITNGEELQQQIETFVDL